MFKIILVKTFGSEGLYQLPFSDINALSKYKIMEK